MQKGWLAHYKNKYPGGKVEFSEDKLDVFNEDGDHCVALRRRGDGSVADCSEEYGCLDRHDLSPIPKNSRVFKLYIDGKVAPSEEAAERKKASAELLVGGKILSSEEYAKHGVEFDFKGNAIIPK